MVKLAVLILFGIIYNMPSKNRNKEFGPGEYYHAYNRGVEKRVIFHDDADYQYFMYLLRRYVSQKLPWENTLAPANYFGRISIYAFALMPNHFHLLIKQTGELDMPLFMRSLSNAYVRYFNEKYNRVGSLFQDCYKAVRITSDEQLFQVIQYIELNPVNLISDVTKYPYASGYRLLDRSWFPTTKTRSDLPAGLSPQAISGVEGAKAL